VYKTLGEEHVNKKTMLLILVLAVAALSLYLILRRLNAVREAVLRRKAKQLTIATNLTGANPIAFHIVPFNAEISQVLSFAPSLEGKESVPFVILASRDGTSFTVLDLGGKTVLDKNTILATRLTGDKETVSVAVTIELTEVL